MSAHTEGPWTLVEEELWPFKLRISSPDGEVLVLDRVCTSTKQKTLADCKAAVGFPRGKRDEAMAKIFEQLELARLIALSPELFALLVESQKGISLDWCQRRDVAIAKATGEKL